MKNTTVKKALVLEPATRPVKIINTSSPRRPAIKPTLRPGRASARRARSSNNSGVVMSQSIYRM
jgi:hypothetical protein